MCCDISSYTSSVLCNTRCMLTSESDADHTAGADDTARRDPHREEPPGGDPAFSIITASLNCSAHIREALDSVLIQSVEDYEFIVVDGGSTDGTLEILSGYRDRFSGRLLWTSEPDRGLYDAMNKGLARARGTWVVFLGADDRLAVDALATVTRAAATDPEAQVICGATRVFTDTDAWTEHPHSFASARLPKRAPTRHQSIFVRRHLLRELGGFDTSYRIAADYDLYLRLIEAGAREVLVPQVLSEFRLGGVSSRNARATAGQYRDVRVAHGANPAWQQMVMLKSVVASAVFSAYRGLLQLGARDA